ncbi:MAG: hypothetical protein R2848_12735 [Thermomicrobiales bacterium]
MRRGELDGERQSVELAADFLHIEHQRLVLDERRIALAGAIEEELPWKLRFSRRGRRPDGERSDGEELPVLQGMRLVARIVTRGQGMQQPGNVESRFRHVLEVVQQQQDPLLVKRSNDSHQHGRSV